MIGRSGKPEGRAGVAGDSDAATVPARPPRREPADIALDRTITRETDARDASSEDASTPDGGATPLPPDQLPPMAADQYVLGPEVARGGMGRVVRAVDRRLGRVVALKQLTDDSPRRRIRFAREAQITARLQHPAIVPVYEVGPWPDGGMAYAMKLVSGRPLAEVIEETGSLEERLALLPRLIEVVDAVAYAHSQRVIHRDIKPSNIILGDFGESILIDWGVAKLLDGAPAGIPPEPETEPDELDDLEPHGLPPSDLTLPGAVVGTPAYMAPEQAGGEVIDERADVYALGTMLYHLLSGRLPYRGHGTEIVAQVVAGAPPALEEVEPHVPAELAAVVARAMDRDRAARHGAAELAAELRRFTAGQLVASYRYSAREKLARWVRRHRAAVAVAAAAALLLAAGAVVSAIRILRERDQAETARAEAVRRVDELTVEKAMVDLGRDPPGALQLVAGLSRGSAMWPAARIVLGAALEGGVSREVGHEPMADVTGFRAIEGGQLLVSSRRQLVVWDTARGARRAIPADEVLGLGFHGRHALVRRGGDLVIVALPGGAATRLGAAPPGTRLGAIRDDGTLVAVATGDTTSLWQPGGAPRPLGPAPTGKVLAFSPTGDYLLTYTDMDLPDGRAIPEGIAMGAGIWTLPDGTWKQVSKWDFVDGEFLVQSPDGAKAGTLSREKMLFILGPRDATFSAYVLPGFANKIAAARVAAFSPDSKLYAMGDSDHYVRLVGRDVPTQIFTQRDAEVTDVAWLPDGSGVLAASRDATVVLFKLKRPYYSTFTFPRPVLRVAVAADGRSIAVLLDDGAIRELPLPVDDERQWGEPVLLAALAGDGSAAVVAKSQPDEVRLVAGNGEPRALGRCGAPVAALAAAPGAVAALCAGSVALWRAGVRTRVPIQAAGAIAIARQRGELLTWSEDGVVCAWSARGAARTVAVVQPAGALLAVTPDGAHAVAASGSDLVWIEVASGAVARQPAGRDPIVSLAIAPDGSRAAAGHSDNEIALHQRSGGTPRTLRRHTVPPLALAFSPDGASLLSGAANAVVFDWDLASEVNRYVAGHWTPLLAVGFDPGGAIRTISEKLSRRTPDDLPRSEEGMRAWIARTLRSPPGATGRPPAPAR